jgi:hypothetical protein
MIFRPGLITNAIVKMVLRQALSKEESDLLVEFSTESDAHRAFVWGCKPPWWAGKYWWCKRFIAKYSIPEEQPPTQEMWHDIKNYIASAGGCDDTE